MAKIFEDAEVVREWDVPSDSRAGVSYTIKMWLGGKLDGHLTCSCQAWRYQHLPVEERDCKHTRRLMAQLKGHPDIEVAEHSHFRVRTSEKSDERLKSFIQCLQL